MVLSTKRLLIENMKVNGAEPQMGPTLMAINLMFAVLLKKPNLLRILKVLPLDTMLFQSMLVVSRTYQW